MKYIKLFSKIIFSFLSLILLFSCAEFPSEEITVYDLNSEEKQFDGNIVNYERLIINNETELETYPYTQDARSILPDSWSLSDSLYYFLYGKTTQGIESFSKITDMKDDGSFTFRLAPYSWQLTLYVCTNDVMTHAAAKDYAVLAAHATVDLTTFVSKTYFKLSSSGISTLGSVDLDVYLDGWSMSANTRATLELQKYGTGVTATFSNNEEAKFSNIQDAYLNSSNHFDFVKSINTLTPGMYSFNVSFKNLSGTDTYTWSDILIILPGKETKKTLYVPNIIESLPTAPSNFGVCYNTRDLDSITDYYSAYFNWTDISNSEDEFEIRLYDTTGVYETYKDYGASVITDPDIYAEGSLLRNSTEIVLRLPMGKTYRAQIRSKNAAGTSDWVACTILDNDSLPSPLNVSVAPKAFTTWDNVKAEAINLFRMRYHVQGGTWYSDWDGSSGTNSNTTDIVKYFSYHSSHPVSYLGYADMGLNKNSSPLISWYAEGLTTSNKIPGVDLHTTSKNTDLYANYENSATITEEILNALAPQNNWLYINSTRLSNDLDTYSTGVDFNLQIVVPSSVGTELSNPSFKFDTIKVILENTASNNKKTYIMEGNDIASLDDITKFSHITLTNGETYELKIYFIYAGYTKALAPITLDIS